MPPIKRLLMVALVSCPLAGMTQMIPNQSVEVAYDARGNRVLRKTWTGKKDGSSTAVQASHGLRMYPNPASDQVFIEFLQSDSTDTEIRLYNFLGQAVYSEILAPGATQTAIDLRPLPAGVFEVVVKRSATTETHTLIHP